MSTLLVASACTDSGSGDEGDDTEEPGDDGGDDEMPDDDNPGPDTDDPGADVPDQPATPECIVDASIESAGPNALGASGGVLCDIAADLGVSVTVQWRYADTTNWHDLVAWTSEQSSVDILEYTDVTGCFDSSPKKYRTVVRALVNETWIDAVSTELDGCPTN